MQRTSPQIVNSAVNQASKTHHTLWLGGAGEAEVAPRAKMATVQERGTIQGGGRTVGNE